MQDNADKEAMKMGSNHPQNDELYNLEKSIKILETPFSEVCRVLGLDETEPDKFLEVENCVFFFDPAKEYVFGSAVIMEIGRAHV